MSDTPENAIGDAEELMLSAQEKLPRASKSERAASVCCSHAIHAIIRANDAICLKMEGKTVTRHDDAPNLFSKLFKHGKLAEDDKRFITLLQRAVAQKSGADYGKESFSYEQASQFVKEGSEFITTMKKRLDILESG